MKITPRTRPINAVDFETLKSGDPFIYQGAIWVKMDENQACVNLETGEQFTNNCGEFVVPVDATLTWKHKKVTPKRKK